MEELDLPALRAFASVAEHGSLTLAAAEPVYWLGQRPACRIVRQGRMFTPHEAVA